MQGLWFHNQDSLVSIAINNYKWPFNYKGEQASSDNQYSITLTDRLPEFAKQEDNTKFFLLTNKVDTLKYEILGLTDNTFSMIQFPTGKINQTEFILHSQPNKKIISLTLSLPLFSINKWT